MDANENMIALFTTRTRQMILQYREKQKENAALAKKVDELNSKIASLEAQLTQKQSDYDNLKMAKMIEISDRDMQGAEKRLAKLIRDVNKCITLLSGK